MHAAGQQKDASGNLFRVGLFLISLGGQAPHVLQAGMGLTCEEPNEIELTTAHGLFYLELTIPVLTGYFAAPFQASACQSKATPFG